MWISTCRGVNGRIETFASKVFNHQSYGDKIHIRYRVPDPEAANAVIGGITATILSSVLLPLKANHTPRQTKKLQKKCQAQTPAQNPGWF